MVQTQDIAIVGAGLAGSVMAIAIAESPGATFDIALIDGAPAPRSGNDIRAYAIAAGTRRMLETLGIWPLVADVAQPVSAMDISDTRLADVVRPIIASFEGEAADGEPFAHFVDGRDLTRAIDRRLEEAGITIGWGRRLSSLSVDGAAARLELGGGQTRARLVIGADGARSAVRRAAGIGQIGWPYGQSAIVTIIQHDVPHEGRAVQHFLPGGPFAMLPLPGERSGIVWSLPSAEADRLLRLPPDLFADELARAAGPERGAIEVTEPPRAYPLELGLARRFVADRVALVADAAHRLHPLAGQGLNMGFRDVAALAETVVEAARRGEDIGSLATLERYQRWRRFDTVQLAAVTDTLNRMFAADWGPLRLLRDLGLGLVERTPAIKRALVGEAAGEIGKVPRLLRGESV
jgi:2-octaprenyl-6-methoxyphenol hydroxylase